MKITACKFGKRLLGAMLLSGLAVASHASAEEPDGAGIYNSLCIACHMTGAAGAPIVGKADAWEKVMAKGVDTVYLNALQGVGAMPAKGGRASLTDEEVKATVDYMIAQSITPN